MGWVLLYDKFTLGVSVVGRVCLGWVCRWVGLSLGGFVVGWVFQCTFFEYMVVTRNYLLL